MGKLDKEKCFSSDTYEFEEDNEGEVILIFDNSSKNRILTCLGITINSEQNLVDRDGKIITNSVHESITFNEFGGILKGSRVAIKKDREELVKYFVNRSDS